MTKSSDKGGRMRGGVRRRGANGKWSYTIDLGMQPALRCVDCGERQWIAQERPTACHKCGGVLRDAHERRQIVKGGFATRQEAVTARTKRLNTVSDGTFVAPARITVAEYLRDKWLPAVRGEGLKASTVSCYEGMVKNQLIGPDDNPFLMGGIQLQKLSRDHIRAHYAELAGRKRADGKDTLSPRTIRLAHATLSRALNDAVEGGWISRSPVVGLSKRLPRDASPSDKVKAWTAEQVGTFLTATEGDRLSSLWHVIAMTGMRRGEALALRWEDVNLELATLVVRRNRCATNGPVVEGTTKSNKARVIHLDAGTIEVLKRHAAAQSEEMAKAGKKWIGTEDYVFTNRNGTPLHPNRVYRLFIEAVGRAKLPKIPLHGLRHSHATMALQAGVNPKIVQERLGHSTVAITLDTYSHAIAQMDADAAAQIAAKVAEAQTS